MKNICPKCKLENPQEAKFCGGCGTSLSQKCPICETEQSLAMKYCTKCGVELSKADEKIKYAEKRRGSAGREISYRYKGFVYNRLNPLSHMMADTHTMRYTLDIDEYVLKEADFVELTRGKGNPSEWKGYLWLTNKRLILLAHDSKDSIYEQEFIWELDKMSDVKASETKGFLGGLPYLEFIYEGGKYRELAGGLGSTFNHVEWASLINQNKT